MHRGNVHETYALTCGNARRCALVGPNSSEKSSLQISVLGTIRGKLGSWGDNMHSKKLGRAAAAAGLMALLLPSAAFASWWDGGYDGGSNSGYDGRRGDSTPPRNDAPESDTAPDYGEPEETPPQDGGPPPASSECGPSGCTRYTPPPDNSPPSQCGQQGCERYNPPSQCTQPDCNAPPPQECRPECGAPPPPECGQPACAQAPPPPSPPPPPQPLAAAGRPAAGR